LLYVIFVTLEEILYFFDKWCCFEISIFAPTIKKEDKKGEQLITLQSYSENTGKGIQDVTRTSTSSSANEREKFSWKQTHF